MGRYAGARKRSGRPEAPAFLVREETAQKLWLMPTE